MGTGHDDAEPVPRDYHGRWIPGHSGNPYGRPPVLQDVRALARQHTETAIAALAEIVADRTCHPAARIIAARELLDRGHGRASTVELLGDIALASDAELEREWRASGLAALEDGELEPVPQHIDGRAPPGQAEDFVMRQAVQGGTVAHPGADGVDAALEQQGVAPPPPAGSGEDGQACAAGLGSPALDPVDQCEQQRATQRNSWA